ncbi:MAG: precorrin-3B C(17)-methyltransferase [Cyanobacteria bacterium J06614_10]
MPSFAAIATTPLGLRNIAPLSSRNQPFAQLFVSERLCAEAEALHIAYASYGDSLATFLKANWAAYDGFIFCLASGAVVRLIAPLLNSKTDDPAVVVVDQSGKFAISLCGGHQGGGDRLTHRISQLLGTQPVLTGAANALSLPGIDTLGEPFGWTKGSGDWMGVSAAVAHRAPVQVIQEAGTTLWQAHLPAEHTFQFGFPEFAARDEQPKPQARIWISPVVRKFDEGSALPKVQWHPRVLWVGIGCERDTDRDLIELAVERVCQKNHLAVGAIAGIATLTLKSDEAGLLKLTAERDWPLRCFSASELKAVDVPTPSEIVEKEVGTPSVCEAAAITAAGATELRVSKQIVKQAGLKGAVTVAIAQSPNRPLAEFTGRRGKLHLVGTGPGSQNQITPAAKAAISSADVVIGYKLYVDLVRSLLRPGQIVEGLPITQERQRAERAIALASWGLTVAVISSGDCGIYGMAGLVLEQLQATGWDGQTPEVQVFPGVSALQSAASRVGAPLMHDFCAISLSDLLTPWPVIQRRLLAAAEGDFIVALYNPKSKTRTAQIAFARDTFLQHRSAQTPVALARSLYRPDESIILTTLADMFDHPIDMLTTVIIGNRSSRNHKGWFITPRGYLGGVGESS